MRSKILWSEETKIELINQYSKLYVCHNLCSHLKNTDHEVWWQQRQAVKPLWEKMRKSNKRQTNKISPPQCTQQLKWVGFQLIIKNHTVERHSAYIRISYRRHLSFMSILLTFWFDLISTLIWRVLDVRASKVKEKM